MEAGECSSKLKTDSNPIVSLIDVVFSWSIQNVLDEKFFKTQVKEIPLSFHSEDRYFESFKLPLLEDTRALLWSKLGAISRAPYAGVTYFERFIPLGEAAYDVKVDDWRSNGGKIAYRLSPGDLFVLTDAITEEVSCSDVEGRTWIFASVASVEEAKEDNGNGVSFTLKASSGTKSDCLVKNPLRGFLGEYSNT